MGGNLIIHNERKEKGSKYEKEKGLNLKGGVVQDSLGYKIKQQMLENSKNIASRSVLGGIESLFF